MLTWLFQWFTPRGPFDLALKMMFVVMCIIASNVLFAAVYLGSQPVTLGYYVWNALFVGLPWLSFFFVILVQQDRAKAILQERNRVDGLTGLTNRVTFLEVVQRSIDSGESGVLLMLDADHFKQINDKFGHAAGDDCLRGLADAIRRNMRDGDIAGRLGGEEFGVFLRGVGKSQGRTIAQRMIGPHNILIDEGRAQHTTSFSIGAVVVRGQRRLSLLLKASDDALYAAKSQGRRRCVFADDVDDLTDLPLVPRDGASAA